MHATNPNSSFRYLRGKIFILKLVFSFFLSSFLFLFPFFFLFFFFFSCTQQGGFNDFNVKLANIAGLCNIYRTAKPRGKYIKYESFDMNFNDKLFRIPEKVTTKIIALLRFIYHNVIFQVSLFRPSGEPCSVHLRRQLVSLFQSVTFPTNHSSAFRTRASLHSAAALANGVDMSLGTFVPMTFGQTNR